MSLGLRFGNPCPNCDGRGFWTVKTPILSLPLKRLPCALCECSSVRLSPTRGAYYRPNFRIHHSLRQLILASPVSDHPTSSSTPTWTRHYCAVCKGRGVIRHLGRRGLCAHCKGDLWWFTATTPVDLAVTWQPFELAAELKGVMLKGDYLG
jgi:hypothetical protein